MPYSLLTCIIIFTWLLIACDPADKRLQILNNSKIPVFAVIFVPSDSTDLQIRKLLQPDSISSIIVINSIGNYFIDCKENKENCTRIYYFTDEFSTSYPGDLFRYMPLLYKVDTISRQEAEFVNYKFVVH
jgi:hypothetical protein